MTDKELSWKFAEEFVVEPPAIADRAPALARTRRRARSRPRSAPNSRCSRQPHRASSILEIGTGAGVCGLWLLTGAPDATLTSIDLEIDYQQHARQSFLDAGVPAARVRLIAGRARDVLPRMNDGAYDLVLVDADLGVGARLRRARACGSRARAASSSSRTRSGATRSPIPRAATTRSATSARCSRRSANPTP